MIDHARELRRYASVLGRPTIMLDAADEIERLAAKLEAAEKSDAESLAMYRKARDERDALRAEVQTWQDQAKAYWSKIEQMEKQEPVGVLHVGSYYGEELQDWEFEANQCACDKLNEAYVSNPTSLPLYALPGAQARPAKNAVAYLDLGTGGYMDVGTDLTDEELAALPKGRHMLGIIGTYGVDGYVPAQNVPSVTLAAAVEMIERVASLPRRITPEQAPDGVRDYCHEAAEGYADGWNDSMKAMRGEGK